MDRFHAGIIARRRERERKPEFFFVLFCCCLGWRRAFIKPQGIDRARDIFRYNNIIVCRRSIHPRDRLAGRQQKLYVSNRSAEKIEIKYNCCRSDCYYYYVPYCPHVSVPCVGIIMLQLKLSEFFSSLVRFGREKKRFAFAIFGRGD